MSKLTSLCAIACVSAALLWSANPSHAQIAESEFTDRNVLINGIGRLCIGFYCDSGDILASSIEMRTAVPAILFDDRSFNPSENDWKLQANSSVIGGGNFFDLIDETAGTVPFRVEANAPLFSLFVAESGNVGLETSLPQTDLHIVDTLQTELRLETTKDSDWAMGAVQSGFYITDEFNDNRVMRILNGAPDGAMTIVNNGYVGFGTQGPDAPLEVSSDEAFTFFRLTAKGAAVNENVDITFTGGPLGTGQLRYNIVDGDNQEMSLDADGNMVIDGTLTTAGPTCASGCDRVFDADYALTSITDHADQMFDLGHLPALKPVLPGAPVNVTEQMGGMLNALEHAHIYITQLHDSASTDRAELERVKDQNAQLIAQMAQLQTRIEEIETNQ